MYIRARYVAIPSTLKYLQIRLKIRHNAHFPSNSGDDEKTRPHSTCAKRKRCYDVTLSRQEGSTTRHLASAQYWAGLAGGDTGRLFLMFGGPVRADRISYCPLDRMY